MSATSAAPPLTYEDYLTIPDDGKRHEIIDGVEFMSPSPSASHQRVAQRLYLALAPHVEDRSLGEVFIAPFDVLLSNTDIVQPDLLFVSTQNLTDVKEHGVEGPPDLVVEVLSEGNRRYDEVRKRNLYSRHGVTEYWVLDPALETVKVYRHPEDGYERVAELTAEKEEELTSPMLPEWHLTLTDLFAAAN